jgi:hypothetical protein
MLSPSTERPSSWPKNINRHLRAGDSLLICELFNSDSCAWVSLKISNEAFNKLLADFARTLN